MRKNRFLFIIAFAMFIMLPFSVNAADVVEKDGVVYVIDKMNISCQDSNGINVQITDPWYYSYVEEGKFVIEDQLTFENYMYDLNTNVCRSIEPTEEEKFNELHRYEIEIYYEIIGNELYEVTYNMNKNTRDKEFVTNIDTSKFDLKKDGLPISFDQLIPSDFVGYYKFNDTEYLSIYVSDDESGESHNYLYTIDGKLVFPHENEIALFPSYNSLNDKYLIYRGKNENGENFIKFYNSNLNEIYNIRANKIYTDDSGNEYFDTDSVYYLTSYGNVVVASQYHDVLDEFDEPYSKVDLLTITDYKLLSEDNRVINGKTDFTIKFSGLADRVAEINPITLTDATGKNIPITTDNYTITSGSTIVTLSKDYLSALANGKYTLTIKYKDGGYVETTFEVEKTNADIDVYKLIFDANGGTFENNIKTIETEDIINFDYEELKKPTRKGYKFIGFYTKDGKSYLDVMNSEAGVEEDTTFYAKWELDEENPKTFDSIGSSIFIGTISLIGLVGATIYLKKRNKVRA